MTNISTNAVALELASVEYDPFDYVRDYDEFLKLKKDGKI
ncbi:MAG: WxcM-like domain-containing protein [Verrucomicrobia bacterium]|nr:WxcM-like domain-containing protein [Verrucomicrobiota bacterium]